MAKLKSAMLVGILAVVTAAGCAMPQPDAEYCQDLADVASAVDQYAEVDRPAVKTEVLEDINEMGATERCPGFNPQDADTDG